MAGDDVDVLDEAIATGRSPEILAALRRLQLAAKDGCAPNTISRLRESLMDGAMESTDAQVRSFACVCACG